jgi:hypothetical protein
MALLEYEVLDGEEIYKILGQHSDLDVEKIKRQKEKTEMPTTGVV